VVEDGADQMDEAEGGAPAFIGALGVLELSPGTCRVALLPCYVADRLA